MTTLLRAVALASVLTPLCRVLPVQGYETTAKVTHYFATGEPMADGEMPYIGAVACSFDLPLYTWIRTPDGALWQCLDRGLLTPTWVDFYGFDSESVYGSATTIEVLP